MLSAGCFAWLSGRKDSWGRNQDLLLQEVERAVRNWVRMAQGCMQQALGCKLRCCIHLSNKTIMIQLFPQQYNFVSWLTVNVSVCTGFGESFSAVITVSGVFSAVQGVLVVSVSWSWVVGRGWVVCGGGVVAAVRGGCVSCVWSWSSWTSGYGWVSAVRVVGASLWTNSSWVQGCWKTTGQGTVVCGCGKSQRASYYCLKWTIQILRWILRWMLQSSNI